jgi:hypothetical protein
MPDKGDPRIAHLGEDPMIRGHGYHPLREHTGLFHVLAATEPSEEGVLEFAERFGCLFEDSFDNGIYQPP